LISRSSSEKVAEHTLFVIDKVIAVVVVFVFSSFEGNSPSKAIHSHWQAGAAERRRK
jgi:hypothetical protein